MKKLFSITLALCAVLVLTACGSSEQAPMPQSDTSPEAPAVESENVAWAPDGPVTVEIENIDGGSGSEGWSRLASAEADGMTLGFLNLPNFSSSIVNGLGNYSIDDFTAICNHVTETSIVVVRANDDRFPDLVSLADYGKENEGTVDELKASTNGTQASNHIGAQAFARSADFHYTDVPQSNTTDELKSLLGQEADFCVIKVADLAGMASELKVLGAFSPDRIPEMPDVPTLGELGYYGAWMGASRCIAAPVGVSDEVVAFYESAFKAAMEDPEYLAEASLDGITTDYMDAVDTEEMIDQQQAFAESLSDGFWFD